MGVPQFSNPQLEVIKSATDAIQTATGTILARVNPLPVPFMKELATPISAPYGTYVTVLSITGSGILSRAVVYCGGVVDMAIRITLDGVVVHKSKTSSATSLAGLLQTDTIVAGKTRGPNGLVDVSVSPIQTYPFLDDTVGGCVSLDSPLLYKTLCLVEVKGPTVATAFETISGGCF